MSEEPLIKLDKQKSKTIGYPTAISYHGSIVAYIENVPEKDLKLDVKDIIGKYPVKVADPNGWIALQETLKNEYETYRRKSEEPLYIDDKILSGPTYVLDVRAIQGGGRCYLF